MTTTYFCTTETGQKAEDRLIVEFYDDQRIIFETDCGGVEGATVWLNKQQVQRLYEQLGQWLGHEKRAGTGLWVDKP